MKKLDHRTLRYIAKAYGKNYAGDESDPSASEVEDLTTPNEQKASFQPDDASSVPPPGYDGSPEANPNVPVSANTIAEADLAPSDVSDVPVKGAAPAADLPEEKIQKPIPSYQEAIQQQQEANVQQATAQGNLGTEEAGIINQGQKEVNTLPTQQDLFDKHSQNDQKLLQAYNDNKLDPQRYLHSLNVGQKILAGIGMILGGASGNGNLVAQMIDNNINRDVQAQRNSQDQQLNLWKMNKEEYGDEQSANLATKNQILVGVQSKLQAATANAKGPVAQANAQVANSLLNTELAKNNQLLAMNSTLHAQTQEGLDENNFNQTLTRAAQFSPEMAKDAQARLLPGIGVAQNIPVDQKGRDEIELNQEYSNLLNDSESFQKALPLNRAAWTPDQVTKAKALAQQFDELGTRAQGINRLNGEEIKLAEKAYTPGKWQYGNALSAIHTLQGATQQRKQMILNKYGVVPFKTTINKPVGSQPSSQSSRPQTVIQNGHTYNLNPQTGQYE